MRIRTGLFLANEKRTFLNGMEEEAPHPCRSSSVQHEEDGMEEVSSSSSSAPSTSMDTVRLLLQSRPSDVRA